MPHMVGEWTAKALFRNKSMGDMGGGYPASKWRDFQPRETHRSGLCACMKVIRVTSFVLQLSLRYQLPRKTNLQHSTDLIDIP